MIAFITGASSGIGAATARSLASLGYDLILLARRKDRLEQLQKELELKVSVRSLAVDVRDKEAVLSNISELPETWQKIDVLINNAGNAHGLSPIHEGDLNDWDAMLDINVKGLLYISRAITPGMVARKSGFVINIGSIAGKEVYANGNVYCASKHAVDALTKSMRIDLNPYGIRVGSVSPGLVETEFSLVRFRGDQQRSKAVYEGYQPLLAEDIADAIVYMLSRPSHVQIADMVILPTAQASATVVNKKSL